MPSASLQLNPLPPVAVCGSTAPGGSSSSKTAAVPLCLVLAQLFPCFPKPCCPLDAGDEMGTPLARYIPPWAQWLCQAAHTWVIPAMGAPWETRLHPRDLAVVVKYRLILLLPSPCHPVPLSPELSLPLAFLTAPGNDLLIARNKPKSPAQPLHKQPRAGALPGWDEKHSLATTAFLGF